MNGRKTIFSLKVIEKKVILRKIKLLNIATIMRVAIYKMTELTNTPSTCITIKSYQNIFVP
jgi:hypothetical protein